MIRIRDALRARPPRNSEFHTIAVDGRGAAGKSALTERLKHLLPEFVVLNGDDYFEPTPGERAWGNFNEKRFHEDVIEPLRRGPEFVYRPYDWDAEPAVGELLLSASSGFCLERCFSFTLGLDWDLKLWVETPRALCLQRGLARDHLAPKRLLEVWRDVWQPLEDDYIRHVRPRETADFVLDGTQPFEAQIT